VHEPRGVWGTHVSPKFEVVYTSPLFVAIAFVPFEEHEIDDQFPCIPLSFHEFPEFWEHHTYPSELPTYITGEPSAAAIDDHVPNVPPG
jgi:hypothetical protein